MKHLLNHTHIVSAPIGKGDAGIILRADGSFNVFSCQDLHADGSMTIEQQVQATRLMALAAALSIPAVMDTLIQLSQDPDIVGEPGVDLPEAIVN